MSKTRFPRRLFLLQTWLANGSEFSSRCLEGCTVRHSKALLNGQKVTAIRDLEICLQTLSWPSHRHDIDLSLYVEQVGPSGHGLRRKTVVESTGMIEFSLVKVLNWKYRPNLSYLKIWAVVDVASSSVNANVRDKSGSWGHGWAHPKDNIDRQPKLVFSGLCLTNFTG